MSPNHVLRFLLELALLASLAYGGYSVPASPWSYVLMLALPLAAAALWGTFVSPKALHPLLDPWRLVLELVLFGSAVVALATAGRVLLATVLGLLVGLHLALTFALGQRPRR